MLFRPIRPAASFRLGRMRGGAAAVEFAFVCLPLFVLIAAAIELGRAMMVVEYMGNAARAACRYAVVQSAPTNGTNLTNIKAKATNTLAIAMVNSSTITVSYYTPTSPSYTPPTSSSTWSSYPSAANSHPTSGDFVQVKVQANAKDVTWLPFYWFLGKSQVFSVDEDMVVE